MPDGKRYLADDYEIVYAPSLEVLMAAHDHVAKAAPATLAAVINPTGDLAGTEKEEPSWRRIFQSVRARR